MKVGLNVCLAKRRMRHVFPTALSPIVSSLIDGGVPACVESFGCVGKGGRAGMVRDGDKGRLDGVEQNKNYVGKVARRVRSERRAQCLTICARKLASTCRFI